MRVCEVAVLGQGLMGSAALDALLRRGVDALGFDPLAPGGDAGSSHGSCRIFRRFNFENPGYTDLSDAAHAGWMRLGGEAGQDLLLPAPVLETGQPGSVMVAASIAAAMAKGQVPQRLDGAEVNARFAAFNLPPRWDAVIHDGGAVLLAEQGLRALQARAVTADRIIREAARIEPRPDGVFLHAASQTVRAKTAILALGPWIGRALPALAPVLTVTRQAVGWFKPAQPETVRYGAFPIFLLARNEAEGQKQVLYGFPDFEGRGVKAAPHDHGPVVDADAWGPAAADAELATTRACLEELIPGAAGPIVDRDVCLYTNTARADRRPDAGEEFILDRWPASRLIVASPCSGHGAKFAPAIGEILARLAIDPGYETDPMFRLSRFSAFPDLESGGR